jgi:hypothetical protein
VDDLRSGRFRGRPACLGTTSGGQPDRGQQQERVTQQKQSPRLV